MSNEITAAFVQQYNANIQLLSQQNGSRLAMAVRNETVKGKNAFFDQIGATAANRRTSRHADTVQVNTPHSRRMVSVVDFDWSDLIDDEDKVRMLTDPTSAYAINAANAMARSKDDEIIAAAIGTAYTGETGTTAVALPATQKIAVGAAALTLAKLTSAKEILDANDVDESIPRFCVVTSKQVSDLLNLTEIKSSDYNTVKALAMGQIDTYLGFKFIRSERLTKDPAAATTRRCFAFAADGLLLGTGQDTKAEITKRSDKNYATQVFFSQTIGATRMEEKKVVQIDCLIP